MSAVTDALRYDGYGVTIDTDGAFASPWQYQGALDVAPNANPLYDLRARMYEPSLGAFTSLDSVLGNAANPALDEPLPVRRGESDDADRSRGHTAYNLDRGGGVEEDMRQRLYAYRALRRMFETATRESDFDGPAQPGRLRCRDPGMSEARCRTRRVRRAAR